MQVERQSRKKVTGNVHIYRFRNPYKEERNVRKVEWNPLREICRNKREKGAWIDQTTVGVGVRVRNQCPGIPNLGGRNDRLMNG